MVYLALGISFGRRVGFYPETYPQFRLRIYRAFACILDVLRVVSVHLCLPTFWAERPLCSYLGSDSLRTLNTHHIIDPHTSLQNDHHLLCPCLKPPPYTDHGVKRSLFCSQTSSNLYTSYATSSYGCALHIHTRLLSTSPQLRTTNNIFTNR